MAGDKYVELTKIKPMGTRPRSRSDIAMKIRTDSQESLGSSLLEEEDQQQRKGVGGRRALYMLIAMCVGLACVLAVLAVAGVDVLNMNSAIASSEPDFGALTIAEEIAAAAKICGAEDNPNGKVIEVTSDMQSEYVAALEKNFYTTPLEIFHLSDGDLVSMDIPLPVVKCIRAVEDSYTNNCAHGGVRSGTKCTDCLGGWSGADCNTWSGAEGGDSEGEISDAATAAQAEWDAIQAEFTPMPGSVGYGVDIVTGQKKLPVVALSYGGKNAPFWTNSHGDTFNLPREAQFEPISTGFSSTPFKSWAFKAMSSYVSHVLASSTALTGSGGVFGEMSSVQTFFDKYFDGDEGFAVAQQQFQLHKMTLESPEVGGLQAQCKRALLSLPPDYSTPENQALYKLFIEFWGTSFAKSSTNGGIIQGRVAFDKGLISDQGKTEADVAAVVLTEIKTRASGEASQLPAGYTYIDETGYGGNPEVEVKLDGSDAWVDSIDMAPVPIEYTLSDISALVEDPQVRQNVQKSIQAYIAEFQDTWGNLDTCPTCTAFGSCTSPAEVCTCTGANVEGVRCEKCKAGWDSPAHGCKTAICTQGCAKGSCTAPDKCKCIANAAGAACDACAEGWSGDKCDTPHQCSKGFTGDACDKGQDCFACHGTGQIENPPWTAIKCTKCASYPGTGQIPSTCQKCSTCKFSVCECF
jgi:hypothetical protein